jgi:ATP-binding cassette, subfamily C, bacterial CydCD
MKPIDPRLLRHARHSRSGIVLLAAIGAGQAVATVALAVALTWFLTGTRGPAVILLGASFAARALLSWAEQVVAHRTAASVSDELRRSLVRAVARRGPAWVASFGRGRLTALLTSGLDALRPWFAGYLPAVILGVLLPPLVLLVLFRVDPASAVIALVTLPLIPLLGALIGWATQARASERWNADARLAGHFLDVVRGLGTLRTFGRASRQVEVISELTDRHRSATLRVLRVAFLSSTALDLVGTLSVGLIAVSAGLRVASGHLSLGPALLIILLAPEVYRPLREMAARYHAATDATAVISDVDAVLTDVPAVVAGGGRPGVVASGLRVRYAGAGSDALVLPSLVAGAGEIVALVGPSGAGKTTALRVLAGVQAADSGSVTVNGKPVYVPQKPSLPHARMVADLFPAGTSVGSISAALEGVGLGGRSRWEPEGVEVLAADPDPLVLGSEAVAGEREADAGGADADAEVVVAEPEGRVVSAEPQARAVSTEPQARAVSTEPQARAVSTEPQAAAGEARACVLGAEPQASAEPRTLFAKSPTVLADERYVSPKPHAAPTQRWAGFSKAAGSDIFPPSSTIAPSSADPVTAATPLGENGAGVSAGQKQRIALAAALFRTPATLLLDEPTAHLDPETEQTVIARLREAAAAGSAIVVAAHRPALIAAADRIVEIEPPSPQDVSGEPTAAAASIPAPTDPAKETNPASTTRPATKTGPATVTTPSTDTNPTTETGPAPETTPKLRWRHPAIAVALGSSSSLAGVLLTGAAAWLLIRAATLPPVLTLSAAVVLVRGSAVARPLLRYLERLVSHDLAFKRLGKRRARIYEALIPRVPGPNLRRRGDLLTKVVSDVDAQVDGLLRAGLPAKAAWVTLAVGVTVATLVSPRLAIPLGIAVLVSGVIAPIMAATQAQRQEVATSQARSELRDAMVETVDGVEELRGSELLGVPDRRSRKLAAREAQAARSAGVAGALAHLGWGVGVTGVALALGLSPEWTGVLLLGSVVLGESALGLPEAAVARMRAAGAEHRLAALIAEPPTVVFRGAPKMEPFKEIRIKGLTAGWGGNPALKNLDLTISRGEKIAITGRSGEGKSTLAMVLARFLEPQQGTITLNGRDVREIPEDEIRRRIVLIGDDTSHLFATTIRENLKIAKPTATDEELKQALKRVHLSDWDLDADATMSGGQARRLATARALIKDPDLLILDEPTEGLDEPTAQALMDDLLDATNGHTVLVLTHRDVGLNTRTLKDGALR